jgi:HTH-type transcriptional regulator/antitoxin HigA
MEEGLREMTATLTEYQSLLVELAPRPILSAREHQRALRQIERLMTPVPNREQSEMIDLLATLIEQYESSKHPTPACAPRDLLAHLLENHGLTRAELARQTGIPRSAITNILRGRRGISIQCARCLATFFKIDIGAFFDA